MKCLVVDDDEMSRATIEHYITQTESLEIIGVCSNAIDALNELKKQAIDLIFLDVEMPEMSGLEMLESLGNPPKVILITSKKEYALEAFEYNVVDYLLKPIDYVRFLKAINKLGELHSKGSINIDSEDIFIKTDLKFVKINFADIHFIEAMADYVIINLGSAKHIIHSTMKAIEKKLSSDSFTRVHRSYIVNLKKIDAVENATIVINEQRIPIGASYRPDFMKRLKML